LASNSHKWYTGTVQTHERGGAGGAQPPLNCLTRLNATLHCKDQAAISKLVEQEQWAAEGVQPQLNRSYYIRYSYNAGCSAGFAPFFVILLVGLDPPDPPPP